MEYSSTGKWNIALIVVFASEKIKQPEILRFDQEMLQPILGYLQNSMFTELDVIRTSCHVCYFYLKGELL